MQPLTIGISIRLWTPNSGGLQYHAAGLVRHLRERGHKVIIVTRAVTRAPSYHDFFFFSESKSEFAAIDRELKILRHPHFLNPLMWLALKCAGRPKLNSAAIRLYQAIYAGRAQRYFSGADIIHHVGNGSEMIGFAAAAAARRLGAPFVIQPTIHPGQWGDFEIDFRLYKRADNLLVHTNYEKSFFQRRGLSKTMTVVGNGIEGRDDGNGSRFRSRFDISGQVVLFIGRKEADKGYPLVLQAFARLQKRLEGVTLVCIGPGKADDHRLQNVIELEYCDEATKHDALAACDVLCVPSEAESFGLIYMEAACYQKAIIARRLPVLEELLGGEDAAVLLGERGATDNRVHISADDLAAGIERLLSSGERRMQLGKNAFRVSRRFIWPAVAGRFETAYYNACGPQTVRQTSTLPMQQAS